MNGMSWGIGSARIKMCVVVQGNRRTGRLMVGRFFHSEETAVRFCPCPCTFAPCVVVDVVDHSTIVVRILYTSFDGDGGD